MTDQTAQLQALIDYDPDIDFGGEVFELHGQVNIPAHAVVKNLKAVVPNWDVDRKVFSIPNADGVEIDGLTIDIGADPSKGALGTSQAIDVLGGRNASLKNIEVTGKGRGTMVRLLNLVASVVDDPYLHDGQHDATSGPEQLIGIWSLYCRGLTINRPRVHRLLSADGRPWQTDGLTFSGCVDAVVNEPDIEKTGEGIDFTGSLANVRGKVIGGQIRDCDSFGVKFANAPQFCEARGVTVIRAGYAAFEWSGMSEAGNAALAYGGGVYDCKAIDTAVGNANWSAQNTAGVRIEQGSYLTAYPTGITIENVLAVSGAAKYGFLTQTTGNRKVGTTCTSIGHTVAATSGTWLS